MTTLPILEGKVLLNTTDTYSEIKQQPEMWQLTEEIIKDIKSDFDKFIKDIEENATGKLKVLFTGAGSSAYVGDILRTAIDTKHMPKWDFESVPTTHFVTGIDVAMEEQEQIKSKESVSGMKVGLMGPFAVVGDSIFGSLIPTIFGC